MPIAFAVPALATAEMERTFAEWAVSRDTELVILLRHTLKVREAVVSRPVAGQAVLL